MEDYFDGITNYEDSDKTRMESKSNLDPPIYDDINKPQHYNKHPSGIECIDIIKYMNFNLGNAIKYIWRCDLKRDALEDLKKAVYYIQKEIEIREKNK